MTDKENRLGKKYDKGEVKVVMDQRPKTDSKHVNGKGETSDVSWVDDLRTGVIRKETTEWLLDEENKECIIWCEIMQFWNLVMGDFGNNVEGVWVSSDKWKHK